MNDATAPATRASRPTGIPTARSVDHVAFTVPDLDQAIAWFVDVLGAEHAFTAGPFETPPDSDWMTTNVGVHPRTAVRIGMLRLGPATNLELFEYTGPGERRATWPSNDDVGAAHLCIYVDDLERAIDYLRDQEDVSFLGEPTHIGGESGRARPTPASPGCTSPPRGGCCWSSSRTPAEWRTSRPPRPGCAVRPPPGTTASEPAARTSARATDPPDRSSSGGAR
jgi:catechol 2,3-dioxygenase-like lactoylglutathione lyase family enzyme